jgi:hypothetical protein
MCGVERANAAVVPSWKMPGFIGLALDAAELFAL